MQVKSRALKMKEREISLEKFFIFDLETETETVDEKKLWQ